MKNDKNFAIFPPGTSRVRYAIYERAKDYAIYDNRAYLIATIPRSPSVEQSRFIDMANVVAHALLQSGHIR
jgi:hypothetical protein